MTHDTAGQRTELGESGYGRLSDAVVEGDARVLLMCLVHLTGSDRWIEEPFLPRRDVRLVADETAGLSREVLAEIYAAVEAHWLDTPVISDPDDAFFHRMMETCLGQSVDPSYIGMMREEMGFASRWVDPTDGVTWPTEFDVTIVGAGASGIAMSVALSRLAISHHILDAGPSVGGVWRDNRYPGCAVDTPNHAYSFSYTSPYRWSRFFSPRAEVIAYLEQTAEELGVVDRVSFGTTVREARWDDAEACWVVESEGPAGPRTFRTSVLISAIGQLSEPRVPALAGLEDFTGAAFHSARWPDGLDVTGQRVAVVGTGASAMQIVPTIADDVGSLTVYQRSPQWARPIDRFDDAIPGGMQWLLEHLPYYAPWHRFAMLWRYGDGLHPHLQKDPDWPHPDRSINARNEAHRVEMEHHIRAEVGDDPDLLARCLPDYPPYGKRILLDNGWFRTLTSEHVELVTDPINALDATGIVTSRGEHRRHDVVVFATGFAVTDMMDRLGLIGRGGRTLRQVWGDDDATAYLGIAVPGFPNFFALQGPNTGLGHGGSAIFQSECQARHITSCLVEMARRGARRVEVTAEAHDADVAAVDAAHEQMIWTHPAMSTYYRNRNGRVVTVMPWRLVDYWAMTHDLDPNAYLFERSA